MKVSNKNRRCKPEPPLYLMGKGEPVYTETLEVVPMSFKSSVFLFTAFVMFMVFLFMF